MNNQASLAAALKAAQAAQGGASDAPIGVTDTMVGGAFTHVLENRRLFALSRVLSRALILC